jgi:hypothetical protein
MALHATGLEVQNPILSRSHFNITYRTSVELTSASLAALEWEARRPKTRMMMMMTTRMRKCQHLKAMRVRARKPRFKKSSRFDKRGWLLGQVLLAFSRVIEGWFINGHII